MNNILTEVMTMLDLKKFERFRVKYPDGKISDCEYYFTKDGLFCKGCSVNSMISELILGEYKIIYKSFEPKLGEKYWTFYMEDNCIKVKELEWQDNFIDWMYYKLGFCYKSKKMAEENNWKAIKFVDSGVDVKINYRGNLINS